MSEDPVFSNAAPSDDAATLLARVGVAERAGRHRMNASAEHFYLASQSRIDDRTAAALDRMMRQMTGSVERTVRDRTARLLVSRGEAALAESVRSGSDCFDRVHAAGLFREPSLFAELFARVRLDALNRALPVSPSDHADQPTMLVRLAQAGDRLVATAAVGLLAAYARRSPEHEDGMPAVELVRSLHARIAWWVAAALRDMHGAQAGEHIDILDAALSESVRRALDAQDELTPLETAAMRLAHAIDAQPAELPPLIAEAVGERRLVLFVALVARASGLSFDRVRDIVIDPDGDRLWIVLRALNIPRPTLARLAFAFAEAEPERDIEAFADRLDLLMAIEPAAARKALAPMALDPDYHAAMLALGPGR